MSDQPGRPRRTEEEFDRELRRVARSMATEELPKGILDPELDPERTVLGGGVRPRRALPGFAAAAASVVVLLLASAVAFAPGTPPDPTFETPPSTSLGMEMSFLPTKPSVLRTTDQIRSDIQALGYRCNDGKRIESPRPGPNAVVRDSTICEGPQSLGPLTIALIVSEAADGRVVVVTIKAEIVGEDTEAARDAVALAVARAASVITVEKGAGSAISGWVKAKLPGVEPREGVEVELGGMFVHINRSTSGLYLFGAEP